MSALLKVVAQAKSARAPKQALRGEFIMQYVAKRVSEGNSNMTAIASEIGVVPKAVLHHMRKLADIGLVERKLCNVWGYPLYVYLPTDKLAMWVEEFKPTDSAIKYEQRAEQILNLFNKVSVVTARYVADNTGISMTAVHGHLIKLCNEGKLRRKKRAGSRIWNYTERKLK